MVWADTGRGPKLAGPPRRARSGAPAGPKRAGSCLARRGPLTESAAPPSPGRGPSWAGWRARPGGPALVVAAPARQAGDMRQPLAKFVSHLTPKRRWFQFRLRTLFVLVGVLCVSFSWLGWKLEQKRQERAAVASIWDLGGVALYDWEGIISPSIPPGPSWLHRFLGDDFFAHVAMGDLHQDGRRAGGDLVHVEARVGLERLFVNGAEVTDAGLSHLGRLHGLKVLHLQLPLVSDAGLVHLKDLTRIQDISLYGTQTTDAGLVHLKGMTQLESLWLDGLRISDGGLAHLKEFTRLKRVSLVGTTITDAGLEHLKDLTAITELDVGDTQVTDVGLAHIKRMTQLKELGLSGTNVTDVGLAELEGMALLSELSLCCARITDGGLEHLKKLTGLEVLRLDATLVTPAGVAALQRVLPRCRIAR